MSDFSVDMASDIESGENEDAVGGMDTVFIETVSLGVLSLELYLLASFQQDDQALVGQLKGMTETLWPFFYREIMAAGIPQQLGLSENAQQWQAELTFVNNDEIRALNRDYRNKDQATDVLTFCALADQSPSMTKTLLSLPEVNLGSVFVSIAWAKDAVKENQETLQVYILERVFHGFLHLLGAHHDTMEDFDRVKGIQDRVIAQLPDIGN